MHILGLCGILRTGSLNRRLLELADRSLPAWASRPGGDAVLAAKPLAVIGASPSRFGAAWAQAETRRITDRIGARVVPLELPVTHADDAFSEDGTLRDPDLAGRLDRLVGALVDLMAGRTDLDALAQARDAVAVGPVPPSVAA